ncbi:hypothetical protein OG558_12685 [Kribbella sp. NBC_01510]|uniref:hypothetical protein n=1 Tax=Kribbella sp. NBC_01510 TaxID=2903581 RepID=UPI00386D5A45
MQDLTSNQILAVVGVVIVALVVYLVSCRIWPFTGCPACKSTGKSRWNVSPKAFRSCRVCGGSGRRRRFGAWALDAAGVKPAKSRNWRRAKNTVQLVVVLALLIAGAVAYRSRAGQAAEGAGTVVVPALQDHAGGTSPLVPGLTDARDLGKVQLPPR